MNSTQYEKAQKTFHQVVKLDPSFEQAQEYLKILKSLAKVYPTNNPGVKQDS